MGSDNTFYSSQKKLLESLCKKTEEELGSIAEILEKQLKITRPDCADKLIETAKKQSFNSVDCVVFSDYPGDRPLVSYIMYLNCYATSGSYVKQKSSLETVLDNSPVSISPENIN